MHQHQTSHGAMGHAPIGQVSPSQANMSNIPDSQRQTEASAKGLGISDLLLGVFLCAVAGITLLATRQLKFGTLTDMGAGFMPRVLALGLLGFGVYFLICAVVRKGAAGIGALDLRPLGGVALSVAVFALTAASLGLAIGCVLTVLVAGVASKETRWRELIIFSVAMSAGAIALFVKGLSLPVPVWPW
jgi:hypothetical protein